MRAAQLLQYAKRAGVSGYMGVSMKTAFLGFVAAVAMLSATATFAADERNVTVVNGTGYGIKFLGFNNPGDNDWSDNELGSVLANGSSIYVKFNSADKGCVWNFRISWADPGYSDVLWRNVNLCEIDKLTLKWDRSSNETSFIAE
jgi:hypothetical protein